MCVLYYGKYSLEQATIILRYVVRYTGNNTTLDEDFNVKFVKCVCLFDCFFTLLLSFSFSLLPFPSLPSLCLSLSSFQLKYHAELLILIWIGTKTCCVPSPPLSTKVFGFGGQAKVPWFIATSRQSLDTDFLSRIPASSSFDDRSRHETFSGPFHETNDANNKRGRPASEAGHSWSWRHLSSSLTLGPATWRHTAASTKRWWILSHVLIIRKKATGFSVGTTLLVPIMPKGRLAPLKTL